MNAQTIIKEYIEIRPNCLVEGRQPLFYTDYGQRWRRMDLHYMFKVYKRRLELRKEVGCTSLADTRLQL